MKTTIMVLSLLLLTFLTSNISAGSYEDTVSKWESHEDVARWLDNNFSFDKSRQKQIGKRLKKQGPSGLLVRNPKTLYEDNNRGYCVDSANFALTSLNMINPDYNARWVFIWNDKGRPHHWVTAYDYEGKLYIMDYGTGRKWEKMQGIHGPYESLDEYREFLASLSIPNFKVGKVIFKDMPGQED